MTRTTGWVMVGIGIAIAAALYALNNQQTGPQVPNAGSGSRKGAHGTAGDSTAPCTSDICVGAGLDGSSDAVAVQPGSQTEAAYIEPTDYSDAWGDGVNNTGEEVTYA